jgi:hypothetical protein
VPPPRRVGRSSLQDHLSSSHVHRIWSADKPFQILFAFVAPRIRGSRVRRLRRLVHLRFDQWLRARWLYTKPNTGWCCVYDRGLRQRCGSDPPRLSCCYRRGRSALVSAGAEVAPAADTAATQQDARPTGTGGGCGMDAWRHDAEPLTLRSMQRADWCLSTVPVGVGSTDGSRRRCGQTRRGASPVAHPLDR